MDTTTTQIRAQPNTTLGGTQQGSHHRQKLLQLVRGDPGIHLRRAAHVMGISWNTCLHHVQRLEQAGLVTVKKVQGKVCVFDRTQGAVTGKTGTCLLRDDRNLTMARFLSENPGVHQRSICAATSLAPSVVTRRLQALEDAGLVERVREGRAIFVEPTAALDAALANDDPFF